MADAKQGETCCMRLWVNLCCREEILCGGLGCAGTVYGDQEELAVANDVKAFTCVL